MPSRDTTAIRERVESFYRDIWERRDPAAFTRLLHEDLHFRGSLGLASAGIEAFAGYVDQVHRALAEYRCNIEDLVVEAPRAFARMTFTGIQVGEFMECPATGRMVTWAGCALFTFRDGRIAELWVLGDLKGLEEQLQAGGR